MVLNENTNLYGVESSNPSKFIIRSKSDKKFGLKFPVTYDSFLKKSSELDLIKSNLRQLLLTRKGERVMLPNFGTSLKDYLMEPLDQVLFSSIRREISNSIYLYAKDVELQKIQVFPLESGTFSGGHALRVIIYCALKENKDIQFDVKVEIS